MQVNQLSYKNGRKTIIHDMSFEISPGQIVGLIGENGCGKTTLMRILAGVLNPTDGEILFQGQRLNRQLAAAKISYQPDMDLFYEELTGKQIFTYYQSQFEDFDVQRAAEIAKFLHVPTDVRLDKLSKGNRARVKLATYLARHTTIYLFDEPFEGLDPIAREILMKAILRFIDFEHSSVLLSTHAVQEIEPILDQVILLKDGKIVALENLEQIREQRGENAVQFMKSIYRE